MAGGSKFIEAVFDQHRDLLDTEGLQVEALMAFVDQGGNFGLVRQQGDFGSYYRRCAATWIILKRWLATCASITVNWMAMTWTAMTRG